MWVHMVTVQYVQWQPGHSLGDQRANTLFVLGVRIRSESETQVIGHVTLVYCSR